MATRDEVVDEGDKSPRLRKAYGSQKPCAASISTSTAAKCSGPGANGAGKTRRSRSSRLPATNLRRGVSVLGRSARPTPLA